MRANNLRVVDGFDGILAWNQTQQDSLHRVEVGGVDEWINALVEVSDAHQSVDADRPARRAASCASRCARLSVITCMAIRAA